MSTQCMRFVNGDFFLNDSGLTIKSSNESILKQNYIDNYLFLNQEIIYLCGRGVAQKNLDVEAFNAIQIPLPPLDIQQKIVAEIEVLEAKEKKAKEEVEKLKDRIKAIIDKSFSDFPLEMLGNVCHSTEYGSSTKSEKSGLVPVIRMGNIQNGKILLENLVYSNNTKENAKYLLKHNDVTCCAFIKKIKKVVHFENKFIHLFEFQTIKYNEQPYTKLQNNFRRIDKNMFSYYKF